MTTRAKSVKPAIKSKAKPALKPKAKAEVTMASEMKGYKGQHKAGSRKGTLHELYDTEGRETALVRGKKMSLADNTLRAWFATWAREAGTGRVKKGAKVAKTKKANGTAATEATASA
jgi:hypothetical protein